MTLPAWIERHHRRSYWTAIWRTRSTGEDRAAVLALYAECRRRRARGEDVVVDHIIPLNGPGVCGLHHRANLEIVPASYNARKSNGPAHPELFSIWPEPQQLTLL